MANLSVKTIFALAFGLLLALSTDIWNWSSSGPLIAGMPYWVLWSMGIVLATGIFYIFFVKCVWRDE